MLVKAWEFMLFCFYGMAGVVCAVIALILIVAVGVAIAEYFKKKGGGGNGKTDH